MATIAPTHGTPEVVEQDVNYLNVEHGWKSWLFTTDHKRIAILYLISITLMFFVGGSMAVLFRINLLEPEGLFSAETYNRLFSMHGIVMVFFFLVPSIPATLANFLIPIMVGAKDLAFPRVNLLSWYIYVIGALLTMYAVIRGGVDTGWTFYAPYSSTYSNSYVLAAAFGVFTAGFSSILTGLNFIVTVHKMRAPGMTWGRLPLFVWANYATGLIQVLGTPVLAITLLLLAFERIAHVGIFDPNIGGDPILFQHLFWFYSHPAVYIMILPGMGVISEIVSCFSHKRIFGYNFIAFSSMAIAVLSFVVWGHHMFVTGESMYTSIAFSFLSFMVAVPSAIKVFNWTATMYKGSVSLRHPHALCIRLHRAVHNRRADRAVPGFARNRRCHARHLLHRGALSLRDGGRNGNGLYGWLAFLVAEDHRTYVSRSLVEVRCPDRIYRFQPDVLPAIYSRIFGDAAPLSCLPAGVSGVECALDGGRVDPRYRLSHSDDLLHVVA